MTGVQTCALPICLLVQDYRVAPYCPRCGTGLSDHELSQGYETVTDPSVYIKFPATSGRAKEFEASYLVWTTTPWTLVSNTALAVNPKVDYQIVEFEENEKVERLVIAAPLVEKFSKEPKILATITGRDLERATYQRPLDLIEIPDSHYILLAEYVTVEDGTEIGRAHV